MTKEKLILKQLNDDAQKRRRLLSKAVLVLIKHILFNKNGPFPGLFFVLFKQLKE